MIICCIEKQDRKRLHELMEKQINLLKEQLEATKKKKKEKKRHQESSSEWHRSKQRPRKEIRELTMQEKQMMSENINRLNEQQMQRVIAIIHENTPIEGRVSL